jgi:hypothetical protein
VSPGVPTVYLSSTSPWVPLGKEVILGADVYVPDMRTMPPTGYVIFYDGSTAVGGGMLDSNGYVSFTSSSLSLGSHDARHRDADGGQRSSRGGLHLRGEGDWRASDPGRLLRR